MYFFFAPTSYWLVFIVGMVLVGGASWRVKRTYRHFNGVRNSSGMNGRQVARLILDSAGLNSVGINVVDGELTDNYDPTQKVLNLSQGVAYNSSVAAQGIVAHEIGHAVQDSRAFAPMRWRSAIIPAANLGSQLGPMVVFGGLILAAVSFSLRPLGLLVAEVGLVLFGAVVVFQLVTFPVEVDASRRALVLLRETGLVTTEEVAGARRVLSAAALTYLAALFASILQLAYFALQVFGRRD
ncbi:MAG: zinc metallopeptidase [Candidatus Dormibacteria bacterium]